MITGQDCENAIEQHRRLNGCDAEHILREAFGRLLAERDAYREVAFKFSPTEYATGPSLVGYELVDAEAQQLLTKEGERSGG